MAAQTDLEHNLTRTITGQWVLSFPFSPYNGGKGVALACASSTARIQLAGDFNNVENLRIAVIVNTGLVWAFVCTGDVTVTADAGCMGVPPGGAITITLPNTIAGAAVYVAGITAASTTTIQITTGFGN